MMDATGTRWRMGRSALWSVAVCVVVMAGAQQADARPTLTGSVDRQAVAVGQTITYTLRLEVAGQGNVERLERPNFSSAFAVLGQSKGTEFRSVNGQTKLSYTFSFQIQAAQEGVQTIGPAKAMVGGKALVGNPVTVKVTPRTESPPVPKSASDGASVFALVELSEQKPYVGSQVQVAYKLFMDERKIGPFGAEVASIVEPSFDGFWIEEVETRDNRLGTTEIIGGQRYKVQTLKSLAVFPLEAGKITIAPLNMDINASGRRSFRRQKISVTTKPVEMDVKPLPAEAPPGFNASNVGQYRFKVTVDKPKVAVGEPFTVRFEVAGAGMVRRVKLPELTELGSARVLEPVYGKTNKASGKLMGGSKNAEIVITPTEEGVLRVPQMAFHFFDPIEEKYKTIKSQAKAVRVIGRSTALEKEVALIEREEADQPEAMKIAKKPLRSLRPMAALEREEPSAASALGAPWFVLGMTLPPLALVSWLGLGWMRRRREEGGEERHRNSAPERAQEALAQAQATAQNGDSTQAATELASALTTYLSERLELPPGAISASRLQARLGELGIEQDVIRDLLDVRRQCDTARFSSLSEDGIETLVKQAVTVFEALREKI